MKKLLIIFVFLLIPLNCFAISTPLNADSFDINNQTTEPFTLNISSNSSTTANFNLYFIWNHGQTSSYDLPGSYLQFSVLSTTKIDIKRTNQPGVYCVTSCFGNDVYLQLISQDNNSYTYMFYFSISKWRRTLGTQVDDWYVGDRFTFYNKENKSSTVYIYGVYANDNNPMPELIQQANTTEAVIITNEQNKQEIIENQNDLLTSDCYNLLNVTAGSFSGGGMTFTKNADGSFTLDGTNNTGGTYFYKLADIFTLPAGTYTLSNGNTDVSTSKAIFYDDNYNFGSIPVNIMTSTFGSSRNIKPYIRWASGVTLNNFKVYPMIFQGNGNKSYCQYNSSINKIDETNDKLNDVDNSINNLNDNITSNDIDNPNSDFSDMEDMIAQNGVITNLIALPINLYSSILNGLNQNCSEYNFGNLFGSDLKFQCINLGALLGNTIWGIIDVLFSGFTIYAIAKKMIKVFNNFSGLQEGDVIDD